MTQMVPTACSKHHSHAASLGQPAVGADHRQAMVTWGFQSKSDTCMA